MPENIILAPGWVFTEANSCMQNGTSVSGKIKLDSK